jgi:hypothetical protein
MMGREGKDDPAGSEGDSAQYESGAPSPPVHQQAAQERSERTRDRLHTGCNHTCLFCYR